MTLILHVREIYKYCVKNVLTQWYSELTRTSIDRRISRSSFYTIYSLTYELFIQPRLSSILFRTISLSTFFMGRLEDRIKHSVKKKYIYIYICMYVCIYIHTHTHTYIHIHRVSGTRDDLWKNNRKYRIKLFHMRLCFLEKQFWIFIRHAFVS